MLGRLGLKVKSWLGDDAARRADRSLGRLDSTHKWLAARRRLEPTARDDVYNLGRFGSDTARANDLLTSLNRVGARLDGDLASAESAAKREDWLSLDTALNAYDQLRQEWQTIVDEVQQRALEHRQAARELWDRLAEDFQVQRAGVMADELTRSPDLPGLPKPDVQAFYNAFKRVMDQIPPDFSAAPVDPIAFNPALLRPDIETAISEAPAADAALTRYFFEATRGYQQALGPQRTRELTEMARNPRVTGEMQGRFPQLFRNRTALTGANDSGFAMPNIFMMLMMFSLMSAMSPPTAWAAAPPSPTGYDPTAVDAWNEQMGFPTAGVDATPADTGGDDGFGGDNTDGDFDSGGDFE